jgi:8-oxo-dGTP diphosphatase
MCWESPDRLTNTSDADHQVLDYAVMRLRAKLGYTTIAFHLLPTTFTLTELQVAYETILGRRLDKRNFRRRMIASGILAATNDKRRDGSHRPAALYQFHAEQDATAYLTPPWSGPAEGAGVS